MPDTFVKIASVTVGSGGATTIDFTSIPSTYTDLVVKLSGRSSDTSNNSGDYDGLGIQFNSSTSGYTAIELYGNGSSAASTSRTTITIGGAAYGRFSNGIKNSYNSNTAFESFEMYLPNYAGASYKSVSLDTVGEQNATDAIASLSAALWSNTSAITSIKFATANGTFVQYSTATLYGIKNS